MQLATSWLQEQIFNSDWKNMSGEDKLKLFEKAKEMEKKQIIDSYKFGFCDAHLDRLSNPNKYYNETYGRS